MLSLKMASKGKDCGCKGIRTCRLCQSSTGKSSTSNSNPSNQVDSLFNRAENHRAVYHYCFYCQKAWNKRPCPEFQEQPATTVKSEKLDDYASMSHCNHCSDHEMELPGIHIIENFVSQDEECELDKKISCTPFMKSQSGRQKQDFGPKVNFKKQKLKLGSFNGLPSYSRFLYERMKTYKQLEEFEPVEMCNLEYTSDRGAHIDPHFDDIWIWGERLVTLNLLSDSVLSFTHDDHPDTVVHVPLLRRSLIVVSGPARYNWRHSIDPEHIFGRRLAMTFRELSDEFNLEGVRGEEGRELLKLALSFEGCAIGCDS